MSTSHRAVGFIFARGGSKGLPGKNIRHLGGKPLIAHSISVALACPYIESVIVSTDDAQIATVARAHGASVPFERPSELATDQSPEWLSWQHAISWVRQNLGDFDIFVSLPATSPLRVVDDVNQCIETLICNPDTDIVITGCPAARSPYFNMVKRDEEGLTSLALDGNFSRRQEAPQLFDLTTVAYVARPDFVMRKSRIFDGNVRLVEVPTHRCIDIDTEFDFHIAEFLWQRMHTKPQA
jgi:CMP-N-acetylneuraminic acid synthetase